jgi:hypothetical protein
MEAVSFPMPEVVDFLNNKLIALRVPFDHATLAKEFRVKWTPTLIILDAGREEHHRTTGFLAPEELIPSLLLGLAKVQFNADQFEPALVLLDTLLAKHARSAVAPEAIYLQGVSRYKITKSAPPLKAAYEKLAADYPASEWTQRAAPYRLL